MSAWGLSSAGPQQSALSSPGRAAAAGVAVTHRSHWGLLGHRVRKVSGSSAPFSGRSNPCTAPGVVLGLQDVVRTKGTPWAAAPQCTVRTLASELCTSRSALSPARGSLRCFCPSVLCLLAPAGSQVRGDYRKHSEVASPRVHPPEKVFSSKTSTT